MSRFPPPLVLLHVSLELADTHAADPSERKIKCNRSVPCDQCTKRGDQAHCHIEPFKHKAAEARERAAQGANGAGAGAGGAGGNASANGNNGRHASHDDDGSEYDDSMDDSREMSMSYSRDANGSFDAGRLSRPLPYQQQAQGHQFGMPGMAPRAVPSSSVAQHRSPSSRPALHPSSSSVSASSVAGSLFPGGMNKSSSTSSLDSYASNAAQRSAASAGNNNGGYGNMTTQGMMLTVEQQEVAALKARLARLEQAIATKGNSPGGSSMAMELGGSGGGAGADSPRFAPPPYLPRGNSSGGHDAADAAAAAAAAAANLGISNGFSVHGSGNNGAAAGGAGVSPAGSGTSPASSFGYQLTNPLGGNAKSPASVLSGSVYPSNGGGGGGGVPYGGPSPMTTGLTPGASSMLNDANAGAAGGRSLPSFTNLFGAGRSTSVSSGSSATNANAGQAAMYDRRTPGSGADNVGYFDVNADGRRISGGSSAQQRAIGASPSSHQQSFSSDSGKASRPSLGKEGGPRYVQLSNGHVRMEIDSDTEDAALVLEGLAMGGRDARDSRISVSKLVNAAEGCPSLSQQQGSVGPDGARAGSETRGKSATPGGRGASASVGAGDGDSSSRRHSSASAAAGGEGEKNAKESDILDPGRMGKFECISNMDKRVDIMLPIAKGGTTRDSDEPFEPRAPGTALTGWQEMRKKLATRANAASASESPADAAKTPADAEGTPAEADARTGEDKTDAEDDDDRCMPAVLSDKLSGGGATNVCKLALNRETLFRIKQGPETMLGFGMGWAWSVATAEFEYTQKAGANMGSYCPGSAEREAVLRTIIRTLPRREIAAQLVDVYASRVYYLTGTSSTFQLSSASWRRSTASTRSRSRRACSTLSTRAGSPCCSSFSFSGCNSIRPTHPSTTSTFRTSSTASPSTSGTRRTRRFSFSRGINAASR